MSNPTQEDVARLRKKGIESDQVSREEAERWLIAWWSTGIPSIAGRRLLRAYLRALDMRDEVKRGLRGPIENADTVEEALAIISDAVKKFSERSRGRE